MNETLVAIGNLTVSSANTPAPFEWSSLYYLLLIGLLLFTFKGGALFEYIRMFGAVRQNMKSLRARSGMGVILVSQEIDLKAMNTIDKLLEDACKKNITEIILILHTFGGYEFAMSRIMTSIRNFPGKVHAYIPKYAMSAGSMISLSCDSIHMGGKSALGAVDVQMGILFWIHSGKAWKEVRRLKGKKANDESIMMAMYAEQFEKLQNHRLDNMPLVSKNNEFRKLITEGNIPHSMQLDKALLMNYGVPVKDIEYNEVFEIVKNNPRGICSKF